jgi:hypothetical protein
MGWMSREAVKCGVPKPDSREEGIVLSLCGIFTTVVAFNPNILGHQAVLFVAQLHSLPNNRIDGRELLRKDALSCAEAYASCSTGYSIPRPRSEYRRICSLCIHDIKLHQYSYHIGDERHFRCLRQQDVHGVCELDSAGATA